MRWKNWYTLIGFVAAFNVLVWINWSISLFVFFFLLTTAQNVIHCEHNIVKKSIKTILYYSKNMHPEQKQNAICYMFLFICLSVRFLLFFPDKHAQEKKRQRRPLCHTSKFVLFMFARLFFQNTMEIILLTKSSAMVKYKFRFTSFSIAMNGDRRVRGIQVTPNM